ncbi:MAG TPA: response regulator [Burkholderiaceae bacterium]|nr:response regulator [Burkholderiaceae bacterium]
MSKSQKTILCIEDDRDVAALLAEDFAARGFSVRHAYDGREGMAELLKDPPDLVLCDINLPSMSGFQVLENLTAIAPRFANMPFIFLTALTDRDHELKGRALGADDFVTKPIDFELLAEIINARLARVQRTGEAPLPVKLTDREIEALTWSARGKTSMEIAQIVGLTKATVDAHLDSARAKLGAVTRIEAAVKAATRRLIEP